MSEGKEIGRKRKKRIQQFQRFKILGEFQQFANSVTRLPETHHHPFLPPTPIATLSLALHIPLFIVLKLSTQKIKGKFLTND
jgi:hypothetical protein